jgi:SMODS-associated and fused to various effectors sensor domain
LPTSIEISTRLGLAVATGVLSTTASFVLWGVLTAWRVGRIRHRILVQARACARPEEPGGAVALVLSVSQGIVYDVRRHLDLDPRTKAMPIVEVHEPGGLELREEVWLHYLERVKTQWQRIAASGVRRVYLFVNMPVAMAVYVGAVLRPGPEVIVAHLQENAYHRAGSLAAALGER